LNIIEILAEIAMSPFSLIETADLHSRAGITRHSHFHLKPPRLFSALRKLFAGRRSACNCR
jgi:hypothetical protein